MHIRIYLLAAFFLIAIPSFSQKVDRKLEKQISALLDTFHGVVGVYIKDLRKDRIVRYNADSIFPTASIVKVPILLGVMDKINRGELSYHQELIYKDSLLYAGADILGSFKQGEKIELAKVMMLMMTMSDNTASLWLQSLAGTGSRINQILDSMGFKNTRVNSRTPGREEDRTKFGWGQTTPEEMATLLEKIYKGTAVSRAASDKMLRLMNRNYFDISALSVIPPYATVFAKYGALNQSRNEVVLVQGKNSSYVFCILTKNNKDQSWKNSNEAWELTKRLSELLWNYYEPKDGWKRGEGAQKFD